MICSRATTGSGCRDAGARPTPAVAGRPAPAHEGRLTRVARGGPTDVADVQRLDLDAVPGDGRELPFRGDITVDAEHLGDQALPLLPVQRGEFGRRAPGRRRPER